MVERERYLIPDVARCWEAHISINPLLGSVFGVVASWGRGIGPCVHVISNLALTTRAY